MLEHEIFQKLNFAKTNFKDGLCYYKYVKNAYFIILLENEQKEGFKLLLSKEVKEVDLNRIFIKEIFNFNELKDIWRVLLDEELVIFEEKHKKRRFISNEELLSLIKLDLDNKVTILKVLQNYKGNNTVLSISFDELKKLINNYNQYEISGEKARSIGFGVVMKNNEEALFIETNKEKLEEFDS